MVKFEYSKFEFSMPATRRAGARPLDGPLGARRRARPGRAGGPATVVLDGALGLHGLPLHQGGVRRRAARLPPLRPARHPRVLRSHPVRQRAGTRARVRRGARGGGRARARAGLCRLPAVARVQRPRGHAAHARGHHQRTARAAGVPRRRASVRRHRHHPDHVVRRRRRHSRRGRPRLALPGRTWPRRSTPPSSAPKRACARAARRAADEHRPRGGHGPGRVRRASVA